jgi:hypothetical protein
MNESASTFRERAGVIVSLAIVVAYIAIGFLQMALSFYTGQDVVAEAGWSSAMNALAGGAVGFLVGKQTTNQPGTTTVTTTPTTVTTTVAGETPNDPGK